MIEFKSEDQYLAGRTEPVPTGQLGEGGAQAVHVEGMVTVVAQQEAVIVSLFAADLAFLRNIKIRR